VAVSQACFVVCVIRCIASTPGNRSQRLLWPRYGIGQIAAGQDDTFLLFACMFQLPWMEREGGSDQRRECSAVSTPRNSQMGALSFLVELRQPALNRYYPCPRQF
jgi:hypothetical protein